MGQESRIAAARRKARAARYGIGAAAGVLFVAAAMLARAAHPGTSHATAGNAAPGAGSGGDSLTRPAGDGFFSADDGGSFGAPQSSIPQVRSGGS